MKFRNIDSCDLLLNEDREDSIINCIVYLREELKIASTTINARVAAKRKFYNCNDMYAVNHLNVSILNGF
jgi:hypothetical protein